MCERIPNRRGVRSRVAAGDCGGESQVRVFRGLLEVRRILGKTQSQLTAYRAAHRLREQTVSLSLSSRVLGALSTSIVRNAVRVLTGASCLPCMIHERQRFAAAERSRNERCSRARVRLAGNGKWPINLLASGRASTFPVPFMQRSLDLPSIDGRAA